MIFNWKKPGKSPAAPSAAPKPSSSLKAKKKTIEEAVRNLGESFQQRLLRMIAERPDGETFV